MSQNERDVDTWNGFLSAKPISFGTVSLSDYVLFSSLSLPYFLT